MSWAGGVTIKADWLAKNVLTATDAQCHFLCVFIGSPAPWILHFPSELNLGFSLWHFLHPGGSQLPSQWAALDLLALHTPLSSGLQGGWPTGEGRWIPEGLTLVFNCLQCRRTRFNHWVGKIPWIRKWQLTPVFLPGEFHGQRGLAGYSPWGHEKTRLSN